MFDSAFLCNFTYVFPFPLNFFKKCFFLWKIVQFKALYLLFFRLFDWTSSLFCSIPFFTKLIDRKKDKLITVSLKQIFTWKCYLTFLALFLFVIFLSWQTKKVWCSSCYEHQTLAKIKIYPLLFQKLLGKLKAGNVRRTGCTLGTSISNS